MNPTLAKAIRENSQAVQCTRELYQHTDCNAIPSWAEEANFRQPNVREKKSAKTRRTNQTSGEFYAAKSWKRDHPELFWKGAANVEK